MIAQEGARMQHFRGDAMKPALFGGWAQLVGCQVVEANPPLADQPLLNADAISGNIALVRRDEGGAVIYRSREGVCLRDSL
jgi:hypothetical protein